MQTTHSASSLVHRSVAPVRAASSARPDRKAQAAILTACAVAMGVGLGVAFGTVGVLLYLLPMPVVVVLLWSSADVRRFDER